VWDINNAGQVTGTYENYSGGSYTIINYPGAAVPGNQWYTEVTSIDDADVMAGLSMTRPVPTGLWM
jgi:hypothetical protein